MLYMFRFFELIIKSVRILPFSWGCLQSLGAGLTFKKRSEEVDSRPGGTVNDSSSSNTTLGSRNSNSEGQIQLEIFLRSYPQWLFHRRRTDQNNLKL